MSLSRSVASALERWLSKKLAHPRQPLIQLIAAAGDAGLVLPVGGNAVLCLFIHLAGADLHLKGDALVAG